jgi:hypothetical protein
MEANNPKSGTICPIGAAATIFETVVTVAIAPFVGAPKIATPIASVASRDTPAFKHAFLKISKYG